MFGLDDASSFDPVSVDLAEYSTVVPDAVTVPFVGYRRDGSTVTASFTTDGVMDGTGPLADFQTFQFPGGFTSVYQVRIPAYGWSLDNLVLRVPEPGTGDWVYQWYRSDNAGGPWAQITGETEPSLALFVDLSNDTQRYYKGTAERTEALGWIVAKHFPGYSRYTRSKVTLEGQAFANLDVTFAAGVGAGPWQFQWYFTPLGGAEQVISGATAGQYTVPSVGCSQRGTYRVDAMDSCGQTFSDTEFSNADLDMAGCP